MKPEAELLLSTGDQFRFSNSLEVQVCCFMSRSSYCQFGGERRGQLEVLEICERRQVAVTLLQIQVHFGSACLYGAEQ